MKQGFTLIEGLTLVLILALILLSLPPNWQNIGQQLALANEEKRLLLFLRLAQSQASNNNQDYQLLISRDLIQQKWCLTVQARQKSIPVCDCLRANQCQNASSSFYFPSPQAKTMVVATQYFPNEFLTFYSKRNTIKAINFSLIDLTGTNPLIKVIFADNGRIRLE